MNVKLNNLWRCPVILRFLVLSFVGLVSAPAFAGDAPVTPPRVIPVAEYAVDYFEAVSPTFAVNADLGRAWVAVDIRVGDTTDDSPVARVERIQIPGLSYDKAQKAILLADGSSSVNCGPVREWVGGSDTRGGCRLVVRTEARPVDDGFEVRKQRFAVVTLEVPK